MTTSMPIHFSRSKRLGFRDKILIRMYKFYGSISAQSLLFLKTLVNWY